MNTIPSLEDLSFKIILENFSRYVLECQRTQDENVKKNMFFLQRKYSKLLLKELDEKKLLEELHLDFLLNEHLQELDVALVLLHSTKDKIIEKLIPISHSILELFCDGSNPNVTEKDCLDTLAAIIPHAENVQKMNIWIVCNNELLKMIASSCPHLSELDITSSDVTDAGVRALCVNLEKPTESLCKLTCLGIIDVKITFEGAMLLLKSIPTLKELYFDQLPNVLYSMHKEDIDNNALQNAKKYNLITLDFSEYYDDSSLLLTLLRVCAELCPLVKRLVVPILTQEHIDACCLFTELESFTLNNFNLHHIFDLNDFLLLKGKKLRKLSFHTFAFSMSALIKNCPKLESLTLTNIQYERMKTQPSNVLQNLNHLMLSSIHFSETSVSDSFNALLNASPNLETLNLYSCEFGNSTIGNLSRFAFSTNLKYLHIGDSDIAVDVIQDNILSFRSLERLLLDGCENFTNENVDAIKEIIKTSNRRTEITYIDDVYF